MLVLDDIRAIARNVSIRSLDTSLRPPGESTVAGRPVANLTFALNYALAPGDVSDNLFGYHALNLAIHFAASLVLFGVARQK